LIVEADFARVPTGWRPVRDLTFGSGFVQLGGTQMMTSALAQLKAATKIAFYLFVAFLVIRLWQDPAGSATATVNFVGSIGSFFASVVSKLTEFGRNLGKK
jgi:hypothetical protein